LGVMEGKTGLRRPAALEETRHGILKGRLLQRGPRAPNNLQSDTGQADLTGHLETHNVLYDSRSVIIACTSDALDRATATLDILTAFLSLTRHFFSASSPERCCLAPACLACDGPDSSSSTTVAMGSVARGFMMRTDRGEGADWRTPGWRMRMV